MEQNSVTIEGHLENAPIYKKDINENLYCYFMIRWRDAGKSALIQIICFGEEAKECSEHSPKRGDFISVDGFLRSRKGYNGGKTIFLVNVVADAIMFATVAPLDENGFLLSEKKNKKEGLACGGALDAWGHKIFTGN